MDRREFLISSGGAAVAAGYAAPAHAGDLPHEVESHRLAETTTPPTSPDARVLRLAMPWADSGRGFGDSARRLALRIAEMSAGRYRFELASGAVLTRTDADIYFGPADALVEFNPAAAFFAGLPGRNGLSAADHLTWLTAGGGQMLWDDLAQRYGVKPLLAGQSGSTPLLWSKEPIETLADLAGRRVYARGIAADIARGLGADPVSLVPGAVRNALEAGDIAAAEWGDALTSMAAGLPEVAPFATAIGLGGLGTSQALHIRLAAWQAMTAADKEIFSAAANAEVMTTLAEARAHDAIVRRALASARNVRFIQPSSDLVEAVNRVAEATIAHIAARDDETLRIDQSYMAFRAAVTDSLALT